MTPLLRERLTALKSLDTLRAQDETVKCKLCAQDASLFDVVDLQKHCAFDDPYKFGLSGIQVPYVRCRSCGFLFTGFFDDWSNDDWGNFIYNDDYIKVDPDYSGARAVALAGTMAKVLEGCQDLCILDYGSGSGVFAARMRAAGFAHVEEYDPFSAPSRPAGTFDIVTCLEVLEHTPSPHAAAADMQAMLVPDGALIFSQTVQPANIADIRGAWWYLAPRNGHISTFTIAALTQLLPGPGHRLLGNDWLWAMAPPTARPEVAKALRRIGPAVVSTRLTAPPYGEDATFHSAEACAGGSFRWSKTDTLRWALPMPAGFPVRVDVQLPFLLEITKGFAASSTLCIGGVAAQTNAGKSAITGTALLAGPPAQAHGEATPYFVVTWQTPAPGSPFDLRGAPDSRALGLAVLTR